VRGHTRWEKGESETKQPIATTDPETLYRQIKWGKRGKGLWEELKRIYEKVTVLRKVRNQTWEEEGNLRTRFY
jgi:hypothetical protein